MMEKAALLATLRARKESGLDLAKLGGYLDVVQRGERGREDEHAARRGVGT